MHICLPFNLTETDQLESKPNFSLLLAKIRENSLASVFNNVTGLHPSRDRVSLFGFGIKVITPCLRDGGKMPLFIDSLNIAKINGQRASSGLYFHSDLLHIYVFPGLLTSALNITMLMIAFINSTTSKSTSPANYSLTEMPKKYTE